MGAHLKTCDFTAALEIFASIVYLGVLRPLVGNQQPFNKKNRSLRSSM